MVNVIINSPSLDPCQNVSGISAVVQFILDNNKKVNYVHFEIGRKDGDKGGINRLFSLIRSFKAWKHLLKQYPNAIIHFNFALLNWGIIRDSLYLAFLKHQKLVVHIHGGNYLFSNDVPFYIEYLLKSLFKKNIPFIVLSDKEKEQLEKRYHCKKVIVIPNCVDLKAATGYIKEYNSDCLVLGYIGRVSSTKGMKELLEACNSLKNEKVPFKLVIAGSEREGDTYLERFTADLGECFEYAGIVFGEKKTDFFKKVDVFVLPSYFEGLPISLLETMSFGCVPITTNVGSINTIVADGDNGLFIEVQSSEDIADKVRYLSQNRDILERMGHKAKETIITKFDPKSYITSLQEIYNSL